MTSRVYSLLFVHMIFSYNILFGQHTHTVVCLNTITLAKRINLLKVVFSTHYNTMVSALPPFPSFNVDDDPTTTGQRWTKCKKRFENFLLAMDIDDPTRKHALLLHYIGPSALDICI